MDSTASDTLGFLLGFLGTAIVLESVFRRTTDD